MKFVGLVSGGKDSIHCMVHSVALGHTPVVLANLQPVDVDEMDSYMYQTVGHEAVELIAKAMQLPLIRRRIEGAAVKTTLDYTQTEGDEVEDLTMLLKDVLKEYPDVKGVSVGAILSNYQRVRVETVCRRLNLVPLSFLWQRNQANLLDEMISTGLTAVVIKVASIGLSPQKHVGKTLAEVRPALHALNKKYGVHVCGEGGEFESLVVDSILFRSRIVIDESEVVMHSDDSFAPVGYLKIKAAHLEDKPQSHAAGDQAACVAALAAAAGADGDDVDGAWILDLETLEEIAQLADDGERSELCVTLEALNSSENGQQTDFTGIAGCHLLPEKMSAGLTVGDEAKIVLADFCKVLESRGQTPRDVLLTHLYVADMATFAEINHEYEKIFEHNPPARVCVGCRLPPGVRLLVDAIVKPHMEVGTDRDNVEILHVQGRSHWAPANIGPYSQYCSAAGQIMMAGQIGLDPPTMTLHTTVAKQAEVSLRSSLAVMSAAGATPSGILTSLCMITSANDVSLARASFQSFLAHHSGNASVESLQVVIVDQLPASASIEWHFVLAKDSDEVMTMPIPSESKVVWNVSIASDSRNGYSWTAMSEKQLAELAASPQLSTALNVSSPENCVYLARLYCSRMMSEASHEAVAALSDCFRRSSVGVSIVPVAALADGVAIHIACHFKGTWKSKD